MRVGVFGGTFDPPHLGHLIAAADACTALDLAHVCFVPAAVPPHKRGQLRTDAATRLEMTRAAIEGDPRFRVEDAELRRPGPSYTVDTLRLLREREPAAALFLLIGADAGRELHTWREPEAIARLATVTVLSRSGDQPLPDASLPALRVPVTRIDIAATEVRRRVAAGESIRYLVPDAVRAIIEREALYRDQR
jgi:nicotinate-nucleotide adenylyltransferase